MVEETVICAPYSAVFSKSYCASNHERANSKEGVAGCFRFNCRSCLVGATSLGTDKYIDRSALCHTRTCARCQRKSPRLVRNCVCVSCFNRELEGRRGLNKRGTPLKLIRLYSSAKANSQRYPANQKS